VTRAEPTPAPDAAAILGNAVETVLRFQGNASDAGKAAASARLAEVLYG
jgi:hypothetical protein